MGCDPFANRALEDQQPEHDEDQGDDSSPPPRVDRVILRLFREQNEHVVPQGSAHSRNSRSAGSAAPGTSGRPIPARSSTTRAGNLSISLRGESTNSAAPTRPTGTPVDRLSRRISRAPS